MTNELTIYRNNTAVSIKETAWNVLSQESQKAYAGDLRLFYSIIQKDPAMITMGDVQFFIEGLEKRNYKPSTINRKIASLSKTFGILKLAGEVKSNPVDDLKQLKNITRKTSKEVYVSLTLDDIKKITRYTKKDSQLHKQKCILILTLSQTGLRISELIYIKRNEVKRYDDKTMLARIYGKGKKERFVYIPLDTYNKITALWPDHEYLFYSQKGRYSRQYLWSIINKHFKEVLGMDDIHPHLLRHFYATHKILTEGKDIHAVSLYLGHADVSTTLRAYVDTSLNSKDAELKV